MVEYLTDHDEPEMQEDLIDFPVSDLWLDHYHEQGLTPRTSGRTRQRPAPALLRGERGGQPPVTSNSAERETA